MKRFNLLFSLLMAASFVSGQTTLQGIVVDASSHSPISFVSVSVKGSHSGFFDGSTTDANGRYSVANLPTDTFVVTLSANDYIEYSKTIVGYADESIVNLDFELTAKATALGEVSVEAAKSQMRFELDKKIFDVAASAISAGSSASDILQNIPSVEVSADGAISLRGSESVEIWLNGRPAGLTAENRSQILEQFPAESIDRIEIITNPSSKYSPEGTAGIINIVLRQGRKAGYYGSLQASLNNKLGYNISANINYSSDKLDLFASVGYGRRVRNSTHVIDRSSLAGDSVIGNLKSKQLTYGNEHSLFTRIGGVYHLSATDDVSLSAFGMFGRQGDSTSVVQHSDIGKRFGSRRLTYENSNRNGGNITLGYRHLFSDKADIDVSADYNQWGADGTTDFNELRSYYIDPDDIADSVSSIYERQKIGLVNKTISFKADYTNKFSDLHRIEAGASGYSNIEKAPSDIFSGTSPNNMTRNILLSNEYSYIRSVAAVYFNYAGKWRNFNYQAGLRGEYTHTSMIATDYALTEKHYYDLFPSLFINYNWTKNNQLQLNYTRRISRPNGWQLNPFKNISDSKNIRFGNPNLDPEYSNSFELNYIKTLGKHSVSVSGYFRNTDNVIQRISYLYSDIMYNTSDNITSSVSSGTEIVLKNSIAKFLNITTTVNIYYYHLNGFDYLVPATGYHLVGQSQSNVSWNVRMMAQAVLPAGFTLQLNGGYNAPRVVSQGKTDADFSIDFGLRKSLGNFIFMLNAKDIFDSRQRIVTTTADNFTQRSVMRRGKREITLSVTYSFGNMKQNNNKRRTNNNDTSNGDYQILDTGID